MAAGHLSHEIDAAEAGQHQVDHQHFRLQVFNLDKGSVPVMNYAHNLDATYLARAQLRRVTLKLSRNTKFFKVWGTAKMAPLPPRSRRPTRRHPRALRQGRPQLSPG